MSYTKINYEETDAVNDSMHFLRDPLECEQLGVTVVDCILFTELFEVDPADRQKSIAKQDCNRERAKRLNVTKQLVNRMNDTIAEIAPDDRLQCPVHALVMNEPAYARCDATNRRRIPRRHVTETEQAISRATGVTSDDPLVIQSSN